MVSIVFGLFWDTLYYKRNIKHFFRIDIQLYQHSWKLEKLEIVWKHSALRASYFHTITRFSNFHSCFDITVYQHGKCFIFLKCQMSQNNYRTFAIIITKTIQTFLFKAYKAYTLILIIERQNLKLSKRLVIKYFTPNLHWIHTSYFSAGRRLLFGGVTKCIHVFAASRYSVFNIEYFSLKSGKYLGKTIAIHSVVFWRRYNEGWHGFSQRKSK